MSNKSNDLRDRHPAIFDGCAIGLMMIAIGLLLALLTLAMGGIR